MKLDEIKKQVNVSGKSISGDSLFQLMSLKCFGVTYDYETLPKDQYDLSMVKHGVVTDFKIPETLKGTLHDMFSVENTTMFEVCESLDPNRIYKQICHYLEVYGFGGEGNILVPLVVNDDLELPFRFIRTVDKPEMVEKVNAVLSRNSAFKEITPLLHIIETLGIEYDVNDIVNNELRVALFDPESDTFTNGDDAVRYICHLAGSTIKIQSNEMLRAISDSTIPVKFLEEHTPQLAKVFNRHKKLLVGGVKKLTAGHATVINRIAKLSKKAHVPMVQSKSKTFVADSLKAIEQNKEVDLDILCGFNNITRLKFLKRLQTIISGQPTEKYIIRNGKVFYKSVNCTKQSQENAQKLKDIIVGSLRSSMDHLKDKKILLDKNIAYGLPTSRKQTMGRVPFGTTIHPTNGSDISVGIYWKNSWGARDLDLSITNQSGEHYGWNTSASIDSFNAGKSSLFFSGDVTNAPNGACEYYMTAPDVFGSLRVNVFAYSYDNPKHSLSVMVGDAGKNWQEKTVFREKIDKTARSYMLGFVANGKFIVDDLNIEGGRIAHNNVPLTRFIRSQKNIPPLTINDVLSLIGVEYDETPQDGVEYDIDLRYETLESYDQLESIFTG